MEENNLISLDLFSMALQTPESSIWTNLKTSIEQQVKKDGVRKKEILPYELDVDVAERAVNYIYEDVAGFYNWLFRTDDLYERSQYLTTQPGTGKRFEGAEYKRIREVVSPIVEDNLDAMRDANEIPVGKDIPGLQESLIDDLTRYILNWQDWFYPRKVDDDIDAYYEFAAEHADIYTYGDYGDLTNSIGNNQYDGMTDIPYLSYEE